MTGLPAWPYREPAGRVVVEDVPIPKLESPWTPYHLRTLADLRGIAKYVAIKFPGAEFTVLASEADCTLTVRCSLKGRTGIADMSVGIGAEGHELVDAMQSAMRRAWLHAGGFEGEWKERPFRIGTRAAKRLQRKEATT